MEPRIFQLNCSTGGVPKLPVRETALTSLGLVGDTQAHSRFHGGPERAVCLYALELILRLQAEGHPIYPGSIGENITVVNLDWARLQPGSRLALGDKAVIEISSYTVPCKNIAASFVNGEFKRIAQTTHPGEARLYARVLQTGFLRVGQPVLLLESTSKNEGGGLIPRR
ncbi:MAG: MOSC domain-containing protein [Pyrinomonadaceae bacterium]|nr:MOSC domain-containing protein [Pyrinomonadaceae bacterium]